MFTYQGFFYKYKDIIYILYLDINQPTCLLQLSKLVKRTSCKAAWKNNFSKKSKYNPI